jgi:peroxiredoxin family protein
MSNRISIMVVSGTREKLQMAAMVASVGAVSGSDVRVFVSMNALPFFVKGNDQQASPEGEMGALLEARHAPKFEDLFRQAVELGDAKVFPCSMAMDLLELKQEALLPYLGEPMGLTKFLNDTEQGQVWSF